MKDWLKRLYWDVKEFSFWFNVVRSFLDIFPGESGNLLRGFYLAKHAKHCGERISIQKRTFIAHPERMEIGDNFRMNINCYIDAGGGIIIGNDVGVGPGAKIWSVTHNYADPKLIIRDQGFSYETVEIGNDVWLGANSIILPGAKISDGVIISAGTIVGKKRLIPYAVYAGYPPRKIAMREP